jgi:hypothetical protein
MLNLKIDLLVIVIPVNVLAISLEIALLKEGMEVLVFLREKSQLPGGEGYLGVSSSKSPTIHTSGWRR